ncbi:unnamed protein product [Musa acuminata subsp. malaccensis]|uniref:(wild Malaysian banana) hypothetical protein n=1 Tax=Musa acuminata subsp. malaccensis TaxID=214687 RepID=A0A804HRI5_MUSAM|nr:PREDICTED: uncharacterized protein LOC103985842 [Musa acuminata subsp. malaccensis]CAG1858875.1 unnamed protein product [Musa acuminata subsp. malaccensis]
MHAKSKISELLPRSFKPVKCKTSLKLAVSRMKLLKNKREASVRQMRRDLAQLLESGQEQTARIRVEHVIREEKTMAAYDLIQIYCELIESRLPIIESQKNCPIDLKEAISSVIFASPRCADIPELMDIRKQFQAKYGKDFVTAAIEVRPECGVSRMMVEKLSAKAPDVQIKIKVLNEVAKEHDVKWDSKAFEEQVQKPKDDLLDGPSSFIAAEKMTIKSSDVKPSSVNSWDNESTIKVSHSRKASEPKETMPDLQEVKSAYVKGESASVHRSNWKMEFKDATSAAEAAAESAERASMAARAAAELASRGSISRQPSSGSYKSSAHVIKSEGPGSGKSSYLGSNYIVGRSVTEEDDKSQRLQFVKPKVQTPQKDDMVRTSTFTEDTTLNSNHIAGDDLVSEKSQFSGSSFRDVVSEIDGRESNAKSYDNSEKSFSDPESESKNLKNDENENYDPRHNILASSVYSNNFDDYTTTDDHANNTRGDISDVVYDNYDYDTDDHSFLKRHSEENMLDSFFQQPREESSSFSLNMDSFSNKEHTSGSLNNESRSQLHSWRESDRTDYSESTRKANLHSDSDDYLPPKFDSPKYDSEGPGSESEDELEKSKHVTDMRPSSFLHTDTSSGKGSITSQPGNRTYLMDDTVEVDEGNGSSPPAVLPSAKKFEVEPSPNEESWRSGLSVHKNQQTQRDSRSPNYNHIGTEEELDERYGSGVLNFGRLTGGLRNRGYTRTPYLRNTSNDASPRLKTNSDDISLTNEEEISFGMSRFSSIEVTNEEKPSKDVHAIAFRPKMRASKANTDTDLEDGGQVANYDVGHKGSMSGGSLTSLNRTIDDTSEDFEDPVHESYGRLQQRKEYRESILRSSYVNPSVDSKEEQISTAGNRQRRDSSISTPKSQKLSIATSMEKSTVNHPNKTLLSSEVLDQGLDNQKSRVKAYTETSSRMPINYSSIDDNEAEELAPRTTYVRGGSNDVKLSRRTKPTSPVVKEDKVPRTSDQFATSMVKESKSSRLSSATESFSGTTKHTRDLDHRENSKPRLPHSSAEETSPKHLLAESSTGKRNPNVSQDERRQSSVKENNEKPTSSSSSEKPTSRESSFKNASHVHPKLPDYDSIAAHFQSLRANVRQK